MDLVLPLLEYQDIQGWHRLFLKKFALLQLSSLTAEGRLLSQRDIALQVIEALVQ